MQFGPMTSVDVEKLKSLLEAEGASLQVTASKEDLERGETDRKENPRVTIYPTYQGAIPFLYVEIDKDHLMIVKGELEKMGFLIHSHSPEPEIDSSETSAARRGPSKLERTMLFILALAILIFVILSKNLF